MCRYLAGCFPIGLPVAGVKGRMQSTEPYTTTRHLVVVLMETGLRGGDACTLPFTPVLDDSADWH